MALSKDLKHTPPSLSKLDIQIGSYLNWEIWERAHNVIQQRRQARLAARRRGEHGDARRVNNVYNVRSAALLCVAWPA